MHIVFYGEDLTSLWEVEIDAVVEDVQKKKKATYQCFQCREYSAAQSPWTHTETHSLQD